MDHLPLPREPLLDPIEVPYRCAKPYDGSPMLEYPDSNRWTVHHTPFGSTYVVEGQRPTDSELESFVQNYLYFGLLHETFGKFIDINKFISKNASGDSIITTAHLEECLQKWTGEVKAQQDPESQDETDWWVKIHDLLHHVWKVALGTKKRHEGAVDERIWFSIAVLTETIQQVLFDLFRDPEEMPPGSGSWRTPQNSPIGKFICDEMLEKGWCRFDVHRIDLTTKGAATLYYLANLQPTRPGRDHSKCTEELCTWMTITDAYQTSHSTPDCSCDSQFSGIDSVRKILEECDSIPLIQEIRSPSSSEFPEFRVFSGDLPSTPGSFIAISHVWAEGLGNCHANELPACSLKWISDTVNALPKEDSNFLTPFWIDTLCVPLSPPSLWALAIERLRKPYTDATVVLVLDSYLYTQDSTLLTPLEIWSRVLCCSWSRRLWTFQEGRLAKTLLYQFADRAILLETIFMDLPDTLAAASMRTELTIAYRSANVIRSIGLRMLEPASPTSVFNRFRPKPDVRDMRESLQARSVSVGSDEALCLFCNMGFDMSLVSNLPPSDRMPAFWRQVTDIPVGLIFSTARQKLTLPGLRWAPASFMGDLDTTHWYLEQQLEPRVDGHPTSNGLEIQVPGFLFDGGCLVWDDSFDILFSDCTPHFQDQADGVWYWVEMAKEYWNQSRISDPEAGAQLAILTSQPMNEIRDDSSGDSFSAAPGVMGVLGVVTDAGDGDEGMKIEVYRHARLHKSSKAMQRYHTMIHLGVERFVMEELGYTCESGRNEEGAFFERFRGPKNPGGENLDNFELTNERRVLCQEYCTRFAEDNPYAKRITLMCGVVEGRTPQASFEHYGKMARGQLQMRRRNRVRALSQTTVWCID